MKRFIGLAVLALLLAVPLGSIDAQEAKEEGKTQAPQKRVTMGMMWSGTGDGKGAKCPGMAGTGMGGAMKKRMGSMMGGRMMQSKAK